jgi:hypothetical protein
MSSAIWARSLERVLEDAERRASMERCANAFSDYRGRLPAIPYAYSRTRLITKPEYELVVMQWSPGSVSPIHDHGRSRCWALMLSGTLEVQNFEIDDEPGSSPVILRGTETIVLRHGDVDHRLTPRELHRVRNAGAEPAYSLQLYAEPIISYTIVDAHSREARTVTATHDLVIDL